MSNLATFLKWINDDVNVEGQELNAIIKRTAFFSKYTEVVIRCTEETITAAGVYNMICNYTIRNEWARITRVEFNELPIDMVMDRPVDVINQIQLRIEGGEYY